MRKIITILCTLIFTINLSANAAIINVNEDSLLFSESKEETVIDDKKIYEEIHANNEVENQELTSNSEIEKTNDSIILKELNTSVMYTVRVKNGEVYEFTNNSDEDIKLEFIIGDQDVSYDYCDNFGGVIFDLKAQSLTIYSDHKITFSVSKGEYLDILVPYEFKDSLKRLSTPMFQKIEIKKGKSYELKSNKPINVYVKDENDEFRYDYLIYDDDGDLTDTSIDNSGYGLYIRENQTYRIAMNSKSNMEKLEFYIPYEDRMTVKELNNPLIKTITLDNKNNYEIINKMKNKYTFTAARDSISNEVTYEIISYDKNGNIKYIDSSFDNYFSFQCDGKIRISILKGNNLTFYVPYDFKYELNTINTPLTFKMDILPDKTYEISNSYLNVNIVNHEEFDVMREEFDVIQYGVNGDVVGVNHVTASTYIGAYENINGITKIRLTKGEKLELVLPYENRNNIKETNSLLLKEIPLQKNKEYKIKNNNSFDIVVGTDIWGWDHIFDDVSYKITYYDSKGNVKETLENQFLGFEIKANESVKLSINKDGYNLHVPYEATIVDDDSESDSEKPMVGDFNNDGKVDILDVSILALKYNKQKGETGWDSIYDLNNDFIIDLFDLSIVAKKI